MNNTTLLHLDASPRSARSNSRQLGREFVATWQASHPTGRVVAHDLSVTPPPFVSESWVEGAFTPPAGHSPGAQAAMTISNAYIDELLAASEIVITTPIYNLSLPAVLKAWIDQVVRFGRTFEKSAQGFNGLVTGKKVRILVASGSDFRPNTPGGAYNFLEPYLRAVLGFIGLTEIEFIYAHSLGQSPEVATQAITDAIAASRKLAAA